MGVLKNSQAAPLPSLVLEELGYAPTVAEMPKHSFQLYLGIFRCGCCRSVGLSSTVGRGCSSQTFFALNAYVDTMEKKRSPGPRRDLLGRNASAGVATPGVSSRGSWGVLLKALRAHLMPRLHTELVGEADFRGIQATFVNTAEEEGGSCAPRQRKAVWLGRKVQRVLPLGRGTVPWGLRWPPRHCSSANKWEEHRVEDALKSRLLDLERLPRYRRRRLLF